MNRQTLVAIGLLVTLLGGATPAHAQAPAARPSPRTAATPSEGAAEGPLPVPPAAQASDHFDAVAATNAYLATVPAEKRARSDAYFEGGYWLMLWDFLLLAAVYLALLVTGWSARMRDLAERITRVPALATALYWGQFLVITAVLTFPLTVYEQFVREHQYGLATQTFGPWLGDQLKGLAVSAVLGSLLVIAVYAVIRRAPRTWWIWGSVVTIVFLTFVVLIVPVYIVPLFNRVTKLDDPRVTGPILSMARANGIPARDVYVVDASRQSTRVSANVSGLLGTQRITLNDNLLKRCTLPEIESVMGHEMGHYVMNHVYKGVLFFGVVIVLGFALVRWASAWALGRWGSSWHVRGIDDVAALPLLALLIVTYFFLLTPVTNTYIRTQEYEADIFGLNAARQPDGEALVDLKLGDYRKLDPSPVEEFLFFDHPSGRTRIYAAMRWKAEHLSAGASE
ncbi:MAG TPA: M48 family metalloprotease [Gemmatimonadales bacterium]|nr:M48 family metalloprotease [Gemmatimonadales bacterium]